MKLEQIIYLIRRVRAFVIRDFQLALSYRVEFFIRVLWILGVTTTFYFISRIFAGFPLAQYEQWKNPLAAWLTGMAMLNYFLVGFSSLATAIRQEQMQGTLESILVTPINVPTVILSSSAWAYVEATFYSFLYLFFGWFFFNVEYRGSFLLALMFMILTTSVLACLGILSASFTMVFKRGDPFAIILGAGTALFSGVFYPKEMLQETLGSFGGKALSYANPSTHGLDAIRSVLIQGKGFDQVKNEFLVLISFLAVLLPFSIWVFSRAIRRAKREGSLIQY
ncbi:MAG: ABC transporter permease [Pyrinomonadaceae bacterium]|nr:ABC transporter permease [Pyrinomonadaceae bacterium]MCX7640587.1 ABC transporter permease [Pyrinomonadaceae bacterium]MDW8303832.1 ABC transporter permease [Acidobacteriota bacterium]